MELRNLLVTRHDPSTFPKIGLVKTRILNFKIKNNLWLILKALLSSVVVLVYECMYTYIHTYRTNICYVVVVVRGKASVHTMFVVVVVLC